MPPRNLLWLLAVPSAVLFGLVAVQFAPPPDKDYQLVRQVVDVLAEVDAHYVRELSQDDRQRLVEDMIDGGLRQLDPHSEYLPPDRLAAFEAHTEGSFGGVGVTLTVDPKLNVLRVESPMPGTPAYEAGIAAGDLITKIGDKSTEGMRVDDARKLITGPPGSSVTLTTIREGRRPAEQDVTLKRAKIDVHPVAALRRRADDPSKWNYLFDDESKIGYVRIAQFTSQTADELRDAVKAIEAAGGKGLILDLRDDPGGLLDQAIKVADLFLTDGKIVSTRPRSGADHETVFSAHAKDTLFQPADGRPIAVLVNKGSASASEIVAAALQDHGRAVVIGERTYGKGSVQKLLHLPGKQPAGLKLTTETYWRPSGKNIHRYPNAKDADEWGVKPDPGFEVATTDDDRLALIRQRRKIDHVAGKGVVADPPKEKGKDDDKPWEDKVLQRAVDHLKKKLSGAALLAAPVRA